MNISFNFLADFLISYSPSDLLTQVATVIRDWNENPASSSKKSSLSAEREEFAEEVSNVKVKNVRITEAGNLEIIFTKAKNNQFGQPKTSIIAQLGGKFCLVRIVTTY